MTRVPQVTHSDFVRMPPSPTRGLTHPVEGLEVKHESGCQGAISIHFDVPGSQPGFRFVLSPGAARTLNDELSKALRQFLEI